MPLPSTMTPIATNTLASSSASITFTSIPQTYTDLVVILNGNSTSGATGSIGLRYNSDTNTNYSYTRLLGSGSAASSARGTSTDTTYIGDTGSDRAVFIVSIQNYTNTNTYKTHLSRSSSENYVGAYVGLWRSTSAITSIVISPVGGSGTYASGSTFTLYGIAAA